MNDTVWADGLWSAGVWAEGVWGAASEDSGGDADPVADTSVLVDTPQEVIRRFVWGT